MRLVKGRLVDSPWSVVRRTNFINRSRSSRVLPRDARSWAPSPGVDPPTHEHSRVTRPSGFVKRVIVKRCTIPTDSGLSTVDRFAYSELMPCGS